MATAPSSPGIAPAPHPESHPKAPEREPLPPGILPNVTDTDPPPLNPATEVGDGYVRVNEAKLHERAGPPSAHHTPVEHGAPTHSHTAHQEPAGKH